MKTRVIQTNDKKSTANFLHVAFSLVFIRVFDFSALNLDLLGKLGTFKLWYSFDLT